MTQAETFDFSDPDLYFAGTPHPLFHSARAACPVFWTDSRLVGSGYWSLVGFSEIREASRNYSTFSNAAGGIILEERAKAFREILPNDLLNLDPPRHLKYRRLLSPHFTREAVQVRESTIREVAVGAITAALGRDTCEFVSEIAGAIPLTVISEMLGVPSSNRGAVVEWTRRLVEPDPTAGTVSMAETARTLNEICALGVQIAHAKRSAPVDDLMSLLAQAEIDGEQLSDIDLGTYFLLLIIAGFETTRTLLSGGLLALLRHPDEMAKLRSEPNLLTSTAIDEMLRWVTPVNTHARTLTKDFEIGGKCLKAGDKAALWFCAGNRDPRAFPEPDVFNISRLQNDHMAFGAGGPHKCLGMHLAKLEAEILFGELLGRTSRIELAGEVEFARTYGMPSIRRLPVRLRG